MGLLQIGVIKCMMLDAPATSTAVPSTAQSTTQKVTSAKPSQKKPSTGPGIQSVDTIVLPKPDIHRMYPEHLEDCDCGICRCDPCADPKSRSRVGGRAPTKPDDLPDVKGGRAHPDGCTCDACTCITCKQNVSPDVKGGKAHPDGCTCDACICVTCKQNVSPDVKGDRAHPDGCTCDACICITCKQSVSPDVKGGRAHPDGCTCDACTCITCKQNVSPDVKDGKAHSDGCTCDACICITCKPNVSPDVKGGKAHPDGCTCDACICVTCKPNVSPDVKGSRAHPDGCTCDACICVTSKQNVSPDVKGGRAHPDGCICDACICISCKPNVSPDVKGGRAHPDGCICDACVCVICKSDVRTMDNVALVKSIQEASKENCECKEQIEEIKRTLEKIKCACSEAEFRSTQSMAQTMGKDMSPIACKPFVKKASNFGQTMSGLKMALNNLQSKCKAKDRMIEAMTNELSNRGAPEVFDKVLDQSVKICTPLDYDQAEDVKSLNRSQLATNVIYPPIQRKDEAIDVCDVKNTASKGIEVRTHKHKKRKEKHTSAKNLDNCFCSKPQIIQREEKDCQKLDLTGFEVIDIRRITDDSIIVKWNAPKNDQVQGYDIFVNGTLATKVMSGTRTSAMMHSLDLTKSVQITIYAVTKCGRVEPPAIAIYEIKC